MTGFSVEKGRKVRHKKTGGIYETVGAGVVQTDKPLTDYAEVVIYRAANGALWVRPAEEFAERFEEAPK